MNGRKSAVRVSASLRSDRGSAYPGDDQFHFGFVSWTEVVSVDPDQFRVRKMSDHPLGMRCRNRRVTACLHQPRRRLNLTEVEAPLGDLGQTVVNPPGSPLPRRFAQRLLPHLRILTLGQTENLVEFGEQF